MTTRATSVDETDPSSASRAVAPAAARRWGEVAEAERRQADGAGDDQELRTVDAAPGCPESTARPAVLRTAMKANANAAEDVRQGTPDRLRGDRRRWLRDAVRVIGSVAVTSGPTGQR